MSLDTIFKEYNAWAERGYLEPIRCQLHSKLDLILTGDSDGAKLICGLCDYTRYIGLQTERDLESKIKMARFLFAREA